MIDSGQYTPETIARKQKIADMLLGDSMKPQKITHWAEGLAQLGRAGIGGYLGGQAEDETKQARAQAVAQALAAFGGEQPTAPTAAPSMASPQATPSAVPTAPDASLPRGMRNNNPLNIEAGGFTQGQPGFSGSDGRFAKFETPEQGVGAANKLLDVYRDKHGLNTVAGIVGRWAPSADGNNVSAYAENVAKRLGIGPNDPIPPEMRQQLIGAMGQHENGRPIDMGQQPYKVAGPPMPPPTGNTAVAAALTGGGKEGAPTTGPVPTAPNGQPNNRAALAAILNPFTPPAIAAALSKQLAPPEYGFQSLPDGTILRTNSRTGQVEPTYQGATKPSFGIIGEDADGKKTYGFIDAAKGKVTPLEPAKPGDERPTVTGPDGKEIVIPKGVDVKTFKNEISKATADAITGKKTEVQGNAEQFANRMEQAEKNIGGLEGQLTGAKGAAQQVAGGLPIVGSALQTEKYQQAAQAKSQFITALLRKESGAAISKSEFERYDKEFFPQPGDDAPVIAQKKDARRVAIDAMKKNAGPSYKSPVLGETPAVPAEKKSIGGKSYFKKDGQWFEE